MSFPGWCGPGIKSDIIIYFYLLHNKRGRFKIVNTIDVSLNVAYHLLYVIHSRQPVVTVSGGFASKPAATVSDGLASKPTAMVYSGLTSKPVATVFSSLASKLVATVFSSLPSKLVEGFLVWASKPAA
jgi:hypothetical protein